MGPFNSCLIFTVHGGWSEWSDWTNCSALCNGVMRNRSRSCSDPEPLYGGDYCVGNATASEVCGNRSCAGKL